MADEFEIQNNPDSVPGLVSTGYQRQNTNSEVARNGLDLSVVTPVTSAAQVTVDISGGVDVNGTMYSCKSQATLAVTTGVRYIKLAAGSSTDFLTPTITTSRGTFDSTKNGYYDSGDRVLDWEITCDGNTCNANKIFTGGLRASHLEFFPKTALISNSNYRTLIGNYSNTQITTSSSYEKILDIEYDFNGPVYLELQAESFGSSLTNNYIAYYKNGIFQQEIYQSANASGITGTITVDENIESTDNIQIYGKIDTGTSVRNPNINIYYY
ncbi:MAG: hypothetical protein R3250_04235, partial [Melioribacteraceae bacterium]|nr:hypothetical protein [Melioribacteraceae bacterium]